MLDHDDGGLLELGHAFVGRVGVVDVVVGELLALDHARGGDARPLAAVGIERRLLVRVLAVAQGLHALGGDGQPLGEGLALLLGEPVGDRRIVGRRARIGLGGELAAQRQGGGALVLGELVEHRRVVGRVDDDGDEVVVLGRGADQRRAADVDVLDRGREVARRAPPLPRTGRGSPPRDRCRRSCARSSPSGGRRRCGAPGCRHGSRAAASSPARP